MRHRRRGDAGPLGRRPRARRAGPGHPRDPVGVPGHGARQARAVVALARSRSELFASRPGNNRRVADAPRMVFLGFGKYARADRIYALEPLTGRRPRRRPPHARLDRGHPRGDHRLAHRAGDPRRDGLARRGRAHSSTRPSRSPSGSSSDARARDGSTSATSRRRARHLLEATARRRRPRPALLKLGAEFFARSVHEVAPELRRRHAPRRRRRRHDRRGRGLRRGRPGEPRLPRADAAQRGRCSARPATRTSTAPTASTGA